MVSGSRRATSATMATIRLVRAAFTSSLSVQFLATGSLPQRPSNAKRRRALLPCSRPGRDDFSRNVLRERKERQMKLILANPRGFCAGVERAIQIAERALDLFGAPVY